MPQVRRSFAPYGEASGRRAPRSSPRTELGQLNDVAKLHEVAETLPAGDERAQALESVAERWLASAPGLRPSIAAVLLGLSEPTVRAWAKRGILRVRSSKPRLLVDPASVLEVRQLVSELRVAGQTRDLLTRCITALQMNSSSPTRIWPSPWRKCTGASTSSAASRRDRGHRRGSCNAPGQQDHRGAAPPVSPQLTSDVREVLTASGALAARKIDGGTAPVRVAST
jgi:hypothetical protein